MAGVEILTSNEVAIEYAFNWTALWIAAGVLFAIFVVFGIFMALIFEDLHQVLIGVIVGAIFGIIVSPVFGFGQRKPVDYTTEYKVTISDEVSMTEFYERYEIVEQDGKIFTIREKSE